MPSFSQNTSSPVARGQRAAQVEFIPAAVGRERNVELALPAAQIVGHGDAQAGEPGVGRAIDQAAQAGDALAGEGDRLLGHREGALQPAALDHPTGEVDQKRIQRAAAELEADRVGALRVEAEDGRGLAASAHALAADAHQVLLLQVTDDLPGGVVGQPGMAGEVGLGRLAEAT